jgi:glutathione S-transferase
MARRASGRHEREQRFAMYTLYWAPNTAAFAPHVILEENGLDYELVPVDLGAGEHRAAAYLELNPYGTVPVLKGTGGLLMHESAAIVLYLCDAHRKARLAPAVDHALRGRYLNWMVFLTNTVQTAYKRHYHPERFSSDLTDARRVQKKADQDLIALWQEIDRTLERDGPYLLGDRCSAADVFLFMLANWFEPRDALFARCGNVKYCAALVAERPAVARVLEHQGCA